MNRPARDVSQELIRDKCRDFATFGVWPMRNRLDARRWLSNFEERDSELAHHLLNAFMYFSEDLTLQLFVSALQNISATPAWRRRNPGDPFSGWPRFMRRLQLTYVTGEVESPADSGHTFARKARDHARVPDDRISRPEQALARRLSGDRSPIVFVDDFAGSGTQFIATWHRAYDVGGRWVSFDEATREAGAEGAEPETYYATAICTSEGLANIEEHCASVVVTAGNVLDPRYSVLHEQSLAWPDELAAAGREMIERVSVGLGIPDEGVWNWRGFHGLGLALGFSHKTPDATIPLFRWNRDGWHPLVMDV